MNGLSPRAAASALERRRPLPPGGEERFASYGIVHLPFCSGDILGFRRVVASSIGPPFTAVVHREPSGRWTAYTDVEPDCSWARYFDPALGGLVATEIRLEWGGADRLSLSIPSRHLEWALRLEATAATRFVSAALAVAPRRILLSDLILGRLGAWTGAALGAGPLPTTGATPTGHRFRVLPRRIWLAAATAAVVGGRDLGPMCAHDAAPHPDALDHADRAVFSLTQSWFQPGKSTARVRAPVATPEDRRPPASPDPGRIVPVAARPPGTRTT